MSEIFAAVFNNSWALAVAGLMLRTEIEPRKPR